MPRGRTATRGQLFAPLRKGMAQMEKFFIVWGSTLTLVILSSDRSEEFRGREIWGMERGKNLWEILLFMVTHNQQMLRFSPEKASKYEYVICRDLPVLASLHLYTIPMIYEYMLNFNEPLKSANPASEMDGFENSGLQSIPKPEQYKGKSIE